MIIERPALERRVLASADAGRIPVVLGGCGSGRTSLLLRVERLIGAERAQYLNFAATATTPEGKLGGDLEAAQLASGATCRHLVTSTCGVSWFEGSDLGSFITPNVEYSIDVYGLDARSLGEVHPIEDNTFCRATGAASTADMTTDSGEPLAMRRYACARFAGWAFVVGTMLVVADGVLTTDADILLYGCDIAASAEGRLLADTLARLTGADVSASDDSTGHASVGGIALGGAS